MNKLYRRSELLFALAWIILYVVGTSVMDGLSEGMGVRSALTLPFHAALCAGAYLWMRGNGLLRKYGLCAPRVSGKKMLFYLPLALAASCNLWTGFHMDRPLHEALLFAGSMLCVGFIEEVIFRGFLFVAMRKDGLKSAVAVSALTFGIGHIVNLLNGAPLLPTLCQVVYAAAFGLTAVVIFLKTDSILPCILAHSALNALSVFAPEAQTDTQTILISLLLTLINGAYVLYLVRRAARAKE